MSHTVRVKIQLRNEAALRAAVEALGGRWLGQGVHSLFQGPEEGLGFRLPGWRYPLVVKSSGELAFDDYNGHWGDRRDIEKLKRRYALEAARLKCEELGWYCELQGDGEKLVVYHPDGGTLEVLADGTVDATGFLGASCEKASQPLEEALGLRADQIKKPEYLAQEAEVRVVEE